MSKSNLLTIASENLWETQLINLVKQLNETDQTTIKNILSPYKSKIIIEQAKQINDNTAANEKIYLCSRCHKPIKNINSIRNGMGYTCYKKWLNERRNTQTKQLF